MLSQLLELLHNSSLDLTAAEIFSDGKEESFNSSERLPVYSITKSITSMAFSLACDDGLVSPEMPLVQFLDKNVQPYIYKSFETLTFSRFLTMTAGKYPFRPSGENWQESILSLETDHSDTAFHYSNIPAYLVGVAVENSVGENLVEFLDRRIFNPLGISMPTYQTSPEGHFYGATGMELSSHELCLLGRLYLQNGVWEGTQLISEKSVRQTVTPYTETGAGDSYGYYFRIADDSFSMVGKWGQRTIIYPERRLVVSYLSHNPDRSDELYSIIKAYIANN